MASAFALLLCGCGDLGNDPLERGDVVGRVLRAQRDTGRVVLMAEEPLESGFEDDGSFRISSAPLGAHDLLIVASGAEALRVPVTVRAAEVTELGDLDPLPAAFIEITLNTQVRVEECSLEVRGTDLQEIHAAPGSNLFVAGPLGAGCYEAALIHADLPFWSQAGICLAPGERRAIVVTW